MKVILAVIVMMLSQQVYAGCEAAIVEGSHTALTESIATSGAWEDAA